MKSKKKGIVPDHWIRHLIDEGHIQAKHSIQPDQIQPASLDLRLGNVAHRVRASFLSHPDGSIKERIQTYGMHQIDLGNEAVLEKGCVYVIPLKEKLRLPPDLSGIANAKSSTGRLDLLTRLITDKGSEFDRIKSGYEGPLYAEVCPKSFSVLVREGIALNQIRFNLGKSELSYSDHAYLLKENKKSASTTDLNQGLIFSVDLNVGGDIIGFRAKPHTGVIDLTKVNHYEPKQFWDPLYASHSELILDPSSFYILVSQEEVVIPPGYAAEMEPYLPMVGEFRVHYAGFFDPGFGFGETHWNGSRGVLEVRCHEVPFLLVHGQNVGRLMFEKMLEKPERPYGTKLNSNYQGQKLKLSKHFKSI